MPSGHIDKGAAAVGAQLVACARKELRGLEELLAVDGLPPVKQGCVQGAYGTCMRGAWCRYAGLQARARGCGGGSSPRESEREPVHQRVALKELKRRITA